MGVRRARSSRRERRAGGRGAGADVGVVRAVRGPGVRVAPKADVEHCAGGEAEMRRELRGELFELPGRLERAQQA